MFLRSWRAVRFLPQMEMAECGAACLGMVLDFFGASVPMAELRGACGVSRDGSTALGLVQAAKSYGLACRALKSDTQSLKKLPKPAILHWRFNHFVVLERLGKQRAVIVDPAAGRIRVSAKELDEAFTGVVLTMEPGPDFRRRAAPRPSRKRYLAVLRQCRPALFQMVVIALMLQVLELAFPSVNQLLVDHVIKPGQTSWLIPLCSAMAIAFTVSLVLTALRRRTQLITAHALDLSLVDAFMQHLMRLPASFFEYRTAGDLMQRVESNGTLRQLSIALVTAAQDGLLIVGFSALMLAYHLQLGLIIIALNLARIGMFVWSGRRAGQLSAAELSLAGAQHSAMVEGLQVPELVRAFDAAERMTARFAEKLAKRLNATLELKALTARSDRAMAIFDAASTALVFWLGGRAAIAGEITAGGLITFLTLRGLLSAPFQSLVQAASQLLYARGIVARIDDVLQTEPVARGRRDPGRVRGEMRLIDVSFRHSSGSAPVLQRIELKIRPGEKLAIVGRSGSGKTTLGRVMLGLLEPTSGQVLIDGVDLRELDPRLLRQKVTAVLQEPFFFDASVRDNLCFGLDGVSDRQLQRVLALACMEGDIAKLSGGLDAPMGLQGSRFSRGQRQRLSLARALLANPRILLLDEATSSLDLPTEAELHHNLGQLSCTRIIIAHRLGTVQDADRILVLDRGQIVSAGAYGELAARPGLFQQMVGNLG